MGGDVSAAQTGVILTGFVYVLVAASVRFAGTKWIDKLFNVELTVDGVLTLNGHA